MAKKQSQHQMVIALNGKQVSHVFDRVLERLVKGYLESKEGSTDFSGTDYQKVLNRALNNKDALAAFPLFRDVLEVGGNPLVVDELADLAVAPAKVMNQWFDKWIRPDMEPMIAKREAASKKERLKSELDRALDPVKFAGYTVSPPEAGSKKKSKQK